MEAPYQPYQTQQPAPKKRHTFRNVLIVLVILAVIGAIVGTTQSGDGDKTATTRAVAVTGAQATTAAQTETTPSAPESFSEGTYLVGTDMPAGLYKGSVTSNMGTGYWKISSDANGQEIVANDLPSGQFYVDVDEGQFLTLTGVAISQ